MFNFSILFFCFVFLEPGFKRLRAKRYVFFLRYMYVCNIVRVCIFINGLVLKKRCQTSKDWHTSKKNTAHSPLHNANPPPPQLKNKPGCLFFFCQVVYKINSWGSGSLFFSGFIFAGKGGRGEGGSRA